jgi:predicted nuclease of predicted toxin-antitoxin system
MILWLDAQLPPSLAKLIQANFSLTCFALRDLGLRDASDEEIFLAAQKQNAVVISKDADFVNLVRTKGAPTKIIWLTFGNTSNKRLQEIFAQHLDTALNMLKGTDDLVEITG